MMLLFTAIYSIRGCLGIHSLVYTTLDSYGIFIDEMPELKKRPWKVSNCH